ncbi:transmembrane protein 98 [Hyalella azteca]|uniref:Transmembrane protein 98 n=1 Tax=Hyalella azteca TaxID=294128 RepID=A0A8B7NBK0_HYAAZ|nr:transmembrane protein 98 [Hyalella azteca]XP_047740067.1 transmembrane protein 98 [Hyalella azteca]
MLEPMDKLGAVALGVLLVAFVGATVAVVFICCRRQGLRRASTSHQIFNHAFRKPQVMLIDDSVTPIAESERYSNLELEDVKLAPQIKRILNDVQWVDDATGIVPHCLAILKLCHYLTERLVASAVDPLTQPQISRIIEASRRVSLRVDDVARAMYSSLDPRLLEARFTALVLTLALLTAHTHPFSPITGATPRSFLQRDIADALAEMERHVQVLREAADCYEEICDEPSVSAAPHSAITLPH